MSTRKEIRKLMSGSTAFTFCWRKCTTLLEGSLVVCVKMQPSSSFELKVERLGKIGLGTEWWRSKGKGAGTGDEMEGMGSEPRAPHILMPPYTCILHSAKDTWHPETQQVRIRH